MIHSSQSQLPSLVAVLPDPKIIIFVFGLKVIIDYLGFFSCLEDKELIGVSF
jgi:hypothetical protein